MSDAAFWDRIAPRYARMRIFNLAAYDATMARVKTHLRDTDRVLELGCGTGSTAFLLAPFAKDYVGTDISGGMIDIAEEKASSLSVPNLRFRKADASEHAGLQFEKVLAFNLLHLVPETESTLEMVHGLLPKGGLFISKTPCLGEKWYYRPIIAAMGAIGKAPSMRFLKVPELDRMMIQAGFEFVETDLLPPSTPSRFIVARKL